MARRTAKNATGFFFCWMGLMAVVCVPSFIAGVTYTESGGPVTVLNASMPGLESDLISLSNTAAPDRAEQAGRQQTSEVLDRLCAINQNRLRTSPDSH